MINNVMEDNVMSFEYELLQISDSSNYTLSGSGFLYSINMSLCDPNENVVYKGAATTRSPILAFTDGFYGYKSNSSYATYVQILRFK